MPLDDMRRSAWKLIPGYPEYAVSRRGRTASHRSGQWVLSRNGRSVNGYVYLTIAQDRRLPVTIGIHRLVLLAFVGPCPEGTEACHENGDGSDNRLENLRWDTHAANVQDAVKANAWQKTKRFFARRRRLQRRLAMLASA